MVLKHASEPIQIQMAGSTLNAKWMAHCCCSWRDDEHLCDDRIAANNLTHEHIARLPESWGEPVQ